MKLIKITTLALSVTLALTACNKKPAEEKATESTKTETTVTETSSNDVTPDVSEPAKYLAQVTLNAPIKIVEATKNSDLPADQQECIGKIDVNSQLKIAEGFFAKEFTPEELKELSAFYALPEVKSVVDFGTDQALSMMGFAVENTAEVDSEGLQKVMEFSTTPIGKKYTEFNLKEGEGTLNNTIKTFIDTEMKKCGIETPA